MEKHLSTTLHNPMVRQDGTQIDLDLEQAEIGYVNDRLVIKSVKPVTGAPKAGDVK